MGKLTLTKIFGIVGGLLWGLTVLLRETPLVTNSYIGYILGIMPNIAASWFFIALTEYIMWATRKEFNFTTAIIASSAIFAFAPISEYLHYIYLDATFDIHDIIATGCAIAAYLIAFKWVPKHIATFDLATEDAEEEYISSLE